MSGIVDWYRDLMYNKNDPRTSEWFLASGPGPVITIVVSYVYFSVSAGPRYMRDRKPHSLRNTLIVYNLIQVILSIYLVYEGLMAGWLREYSFGCQPVDYSNDPKATRVRANRVLDSYRVSPSSFPQIVMPVFSLQMTRAVYLYFLCKLFELLDTVFFVLRKKQRQISFLHVYHHGMMPICAWIGVRFVPGGHPTLLGLVNSFVHIIMYSYYMLAAVGPRLQKHLWWKKYLTLLQLVQFIIILVHNVQILFTSCNFPKSLAFLLSVNAFLFIYLFGTFYVKNYERSARQSEATTIANVGGNRKSD